MKISVLGAAGRMGQMIARELLAQKITPAYLVDRKDSWANGKDIGGILGLPPAGVTVTTKAEDAFAHSDAVIDFTHKETLAGHAALAHQYGRAYVVGTTGLDDADFAALAAAATRAPVLQSYNMSVGVNVLLSLVEQVAQKLGNDFDIEIFEAHHRHKVDAPSGTAIALGEAAAKGRGVTLKDALIPARHGIIGPRPEGAIGISVFRGGDVVGDHTVTFAGTGERIELSHKASDRSLFARGAVRAALFLAGKPAGRYQMRDILGL